ncbi:hypothetical protein GGF32_005812 [Allomyces javanicus]|nr:hypothetical protein GGF32_005812 [Allomyces javanicus]
MNVQALTDRIHHALTGLKSFTVHWGCSTTFLARMVAVLPRTGMHSLNVTATFGDEDDIVPSQIVARLPLATRSLHVSTGESVWPLDFGQTFPLAPTLTHLTLVANESDEVVIEQLLVRLPESLTNLKLKSWTTGRTPSLAVIATNLPPNLIKLELVSAFLGGDDLTAFVWPKSLLHLNLKSNWFKKIPAAALLTHLQTLKLNENSELSDDNAADWVATLPITLRAINIVKTPLGDKFAAALLQQMPAPRATASPMVLRVNRSALSVEAK